MGRHVVVIGGGISGLAAAWFLRRDSPSGTRVTVLEAAHQVGGKLRIGEVAGVATDVGAESILLRRPEGQALAAALGVELEPAATTSAAVFTRGRRRPLPNGTVLGVPADLRPIAGSGLLSVAEMGRAAADLVIPGALVVDDVAVGHYVAARLGRGLLDRLVEPLLGGVYAGRADELSMAATLPQLWPYARRHRSLIAAAREAAARSAPAAGPVFGAPAGGVGRLAEVLAAASGADIRTGCTVRELRRANGGWRLVTGSAARPEAVSADAVVLAVPAAPAARLLRAAVPAAATELATVRAASMAVVTVAYPVGSLPGLGGSGVLVPPVEGRAVKAMTFSSSKWRWQAAAAPDLVLVRASVGRLGEEALLQRDDPDLVHLVRADLAAVLGVTAPPVGATVTRWGGGLPQYTVGHLGRVQRVRRAVAQVPTLVVCGATYDGVGIPACIATAETAVSDLLRQWRGE